MASKWTKEWPTKPGLYWFYGWRYGHTHEDIYGHTHEAISGNPIPPSLSSVKVMEFAEVLVLCEGQPIYKDGHDAAIGMFCEVELPESPDVSGLIPQKYKK